MTLGSAAAHPEVEQIVLAEIEKAMLGVARTFDHWNHGVLDDPRLEIVFNDGRNFLSTTDRKFDVISADPIHPWSGGAGYLYTVEYFQTVARRLDRGGIACQWLPIYELTARDLATVVRSWNEAFRHVLVWKTHYDTVLIGSNEPIVFDEASLARRISTTPQVRKDLEQIRMGTAKNLLEFFLMGTEGARAFGSQGVLNTDDNLWLEFSAPASQGRHELPGLNVQALSRYREDLSHYIAMNGPEAASTEERRRWARELQTARLFDQAHAQYLLRRPPQQLEPIVLAVAERDPDFGPLRFLTDEMEFRERGAPALVVDAEFPARDGAVGSSLRISAARQFISREWVLVSFVDNERKEIYGQRYLEGEYGQLEDQTLRYANEIFAQLGAAAADRAASGPHGGLLPREELIALLREETRKRVGLLAPLPPK
jgi:spermidine synthase